MTQLAINVTPTERDWVQHAARLRGLSTAEYIKRAINNSLCREGVDAVLIREREPLSRQARTPRKAK